MPEAQQVVESPGVRFAIGVDSRIDGGVAAGADKTSVLQSVVAGRPVDIEARVRSVAELARLTVAPSPTIDLVLA